jgi:FemAB-related protein (PEP-CTERM system-associated)
LQVHELDISNGAAWDAFVEAQPEATFFHLTGWARAIERSLGHKAYYFYVEKAGKITGILPLIHINSRLFGRALISNAFGVYGGPVAQDEATHEALDEAAWQLAKKLRVEYLEYRDRKRLRPFWQAKESLYVTFRKALKADNEENMKDIPRKQRAMVRKGIDNGLVSVIDANVDRLYEMYAVSVRNLGTPVFSKKLFQCLHEEFAPKLCEILTVEHNGVAVSSVMNFFFRDEVLPYYGGGTHAARAVAANDFMYWSVMSRAVSEHGSKIFDFGRSKVGTGSYSFKKNWGFEAEPLHYEFRMANGGDLPDINPLNPKYRLMIESWKRLPMPLANFIGPFISKNLG